jgi:hypothetical protein
VSIEIDATGAMRPNSAATNPTPGEQPFPAAPKPLKAFAYVTELVRKEIKDSIESEQSCPAPASEPFKPPQKPLVHSDILNAERAKFEAAWRAKYNMPVHIEFSAFIDGRYIAQAIDDAWVGYQLAVNSLADAVLPEEHPRESKDLAGIPVFTYFKEVHPGWPEFNKMNEFSDGSSGEALVKLADVHAQLATKRPA